MPSDRDGLARWLGRNLDIRVAPGPMEYLAHAFFEPEEGRCADSLVWANRGGGKTFYGAVATLLDVVFKPGIEIKLLAGSMLQAQRMHAHLRALLGRDGLASMVDGRITDRGVTLVNGSKVELLAQSHTSVRGARPQKIRCDEVELFDPTIWQAAQLVTRSARCGDVFVPGRVEAMSTWHRPGGLMSELIDESRSGVARRTLFRWGVVDVLERCAPARACDGCALEAECAGRAKEGSGHITIDDAITLKGRVARDTWESEMLCERPMRRDSVFPEFDPEVHVREFDESSARRWIGGMDFGIRAPTVVLFAFVDAHGVVWVIDEHHQAEMRLAHHIDAMRARPWPEPEMIGSDPAGRQRSQATGESCWGVMREAGLNPVGRPMGRLESASLVRARLQPAHGPPRLYIHRRCKELIRALTCAHYPHDDPSATEQKKDGTDHACDALRYMIGAVDAPLRVRGRGYR